MFPLMLAFLALFSRPFNPTRLPCNPVSRQRKACCPPGTPFRHYIQSKNLVAGVEGIGQAGSWPCCRRGQPPSDSASLLEPPPPARAARARRFSYTRATQGAIAKSSGRRGGPNAAE
jgi:hypothetical protein